MNRSTYRRIHIVLNAPPCKFFLPPIPNLVYIKQNKTKYIIPVQFTVHLNALTSHAHVVIKNGKETVRSIKIVTVQYRLKSTSQYIYMQIHTINLCRLFIYSTNANANSMLFLSGILVAHTSCDSLSIWYVENIAIARKNIFLNKCIYTNYTVFE